jgi:DNA-binding CsgD family transcriptional regulator
MEPRYETLYRHREGRGTSGPIKGETMGESVAARQLIHDLLPERMERMRIVTGLPVVLGGAVWHERGNSQLVLHRVIGTYGDSLRGLAIRPGKGLGGRVLGTRTPLRVNDYASAMAITHDYDHLVVSVEELSSILAVPIMVGGEVRGVVYGAARGPGVIGDRAIRAAKVLVEQMGQDIENHLRSTPGETDPFPSGALMELAAVIRDTEDPRLRRRLVNIQRELSTRPAMLQAHGSLAPREVDTLRLVEVGASNLEIAVQLGLSVETVKAYLRSAMRKLEVHNRTAAAHQARLTGQL